MIGWLIPFYFFAIPGAALSLAAIPVLLAPTLAWQLAALAFSPAIFAVTYVAVAGLLAMPWRRAIVQGVFPRDLKHPVYGPRRLYAAAWTSVYFNLPIYYLALSVPFLRRALLRAFGYRFSLDFTIYPDVWLRDLPCVMFEEGAYIANKSTLGTNMCMTDGSILVDRIKVGRKSLVGHGSMVGPGTKLGDNVEVSVMVVLGIRARLKNGACVGGKAGVSHGAIVGERTEIGNFAYVGTKAVVGDDILVPAGASIPGGAEIFTQADCDKHFSSETWTLNHLRESIAMSLGGAPVAGSDTGFGKVVNLDGARKSPA